MRPHAFASCVVVAVGLATTAPPVFAGGHCQEHKKQPCTKDLGCWIWNCKEVEETVYDVTYKEVEKTVKVPYIREIKEMLPCKACQPVWGQGLRACPEVDYIRSADTVQVETCTAPPSCCAGDCGKGCGSGCGACPVCETEPRIKTCMTRVEVCRQFPVTEWRLVPQEVQIPRIYYVRDWKEEVVTLQVPVKTERTIKRKVWDRVPAPKCGCDDCCGATAVEPTAEPTPGRLVDPGA